jgi:hypothetical protein
MDVFRSYNPPEGMQNYRFLHSSKITSSNNTYTNFSRPSAIGISPTAAFLRDNKKDYLPDNHRHQSISNQPPILAFLAQSAFATPPQVKATFDGNHPRSGTFTLSPQLASATTTVSLNSNRFARKETNNVSSHQQQANYQLQDRNDLLPTTEQIDTNTDVKFRAYQAENWTEKFGKFIHYCYVMELHKFVQHQSINILHHFFLCFSFSFIW